jgi:hypothetical protein
MSISSKLALSSQLLGYSLNSLGIHRKTSKNYRLRKPPKTTTRRLSKSITNSRNHIRLLMKAIKIFKKYIANLIKAMRTFKKLILNSIKVIKICKKPTMS